MHCYRILLSPEAAEGTTPATEADKGSKAPDIAKAEALISKHDSAAAAVLALMGENYKARDDKRTLEAKVPPAGAVVLVGDDAKAWDAYRSFGKPDDLRKVVREHGEYAQKVTGYEREKALSEIAGKAGVAKPGVFLKIAEDPARYEVRKDKDGKESVFVRPAEGEDGDPVPFADHHADFAPALGIADPAASVARGNPRGQANGRAAEAARGTPRTDLAGRELTPEQQLIRSGRYSSL